MAEAGLRLNVEKTHIVPFSASVPKGTITPPGFELYWGRKRGAGKCLKVKTIPKRLSRAVQSFKEWVKSERNRKTTALLWQEAVVKMTGHFRYYGVRFNESKLHHFQFACLGALYRWLNRRSGSARRAGCNRRAGSLRTAAAEDRATDRRAAGDGRSSIGFFMVQGLLRPRTRERADQANRCLAASGSTI